MGERRGRMAWLPECIITEAEMIRREKNLRRQAEALEELVKYARVGREAEKVKDLLFMRRRRL